MSALTTIRVLLQKMTKEEKKVARKYLNAFDTRGSGLPNQSLKLFDLLARETSADQRFDDRAIENLVYGKKAGAAFPRLILRLRDKLFESLLLRINMERDGAYGERSVALYEIRNELSLAQILLDRGAWDLVPMITDECIKKAEKFEHYAELLAALRIQLQIRTIDKGKAVIEEENRKYTKVVRSLLASKKALELYHIVCSQVEFKSKGISLQELEQSISTLQGEYEATGSATVAFFQNYLEVHLYQELGMYKSASSALKRQADLAEFHPAIYSKARLAGVYVNLAWNEIYTRKFANALKYTRKVRLIWPGKHFVIYRCYDTEFYSYFYQGKYELALDAMNFLQKHDNSQSADYRIGKREYQKACVLFMLGKYEQVHKILNTLNPIENDQEGWNLALRTLFIMNDLELEKTDNAFKRIENMRKQIDKLKKINTDVPREVLKFEILRSLVNSKFDFVETRNKRKDDLEKLSNQKNRFRWKILSPELIPFEQWFESKVFRQKLVVKISSYPGPVLNIKNVVTITDEE